MIIDEAGLRQYINVYHNIAEVWAQMMRNEDDHDHEDDNDNDTAEHDDEVRMTMLMRTMRMTMRMRMPMRVTMMRMTMRKAFCAGCSGQLSFAPNTIVSAGAHNCCELCSQLCRWCRLQTQLCQSSNN